MFNLTVLIKGETGNEELGNDEMRKQRKGLEIVTDCV